MSVEKGYIISFDITFFRFLLKLEILLCGNKKFPRKFCTFVAG